MTASLSFTLPEEKYEFDAAVQGEQWRGVVVELDEILRRALKGENHLLDYETTRFVRDRIAELMEESNLSFN